LTVVTGVQTCALPIFSKCVGSPPYQDFDSEEKSRG